jgi:Protein of unknown function (DUF1566)
MILNAISLADRHAMAATGLALLAFMLLASCGGGASESSTVAASPVNFDTGQTLCYDDTSVVACGAMTHPRQDAEFGRDAEATANTLSKAGAGAAGFDYTKVCMNGMLNCVGGVSHNAVPAATDWACTKDNVTGLTWSLQTGDDNWDNGINAANNLAASNHFSNANVASRCGFSTGWRLPTRRELLSLVHSGLALSPSVDVDFFPATLSAVYLTSDPHAQQPTDVWHVDFTDGHTTSSGKGLQVAVRLVRSRQ